MSENRMQISDSFNRKPHLFQKSITIAETRMKSNNQGNTITMPQSNRSSTQHRVGNNYLKCYF